MTATPDPVEVGASEYRHDEGKKGATRGKSRDVETSLKARVLETEDTKIHNGIKDVLGGLEADLRREIESFHSEIAKGRDLFQRELNNVLLRVDEMGGDLAL
ncbi:hypothetical protein PanWU01x14_220610 [Parasponia andersonii]|uniref:Uncharacterized protein n=1 Tax=Parasponia andersonii TaxID=3476 RepID=A0A2P5BQ05_PARAD|nr:hypothetical protein PanWU01x14_220610 [Parasponia andersonii]